MKIPSRRPLTLALFLLFYVRMLCFFCEMIHEAEKIDLSLMNYDRSSAHFYMLACILKERARKNKQNEITFDEVALCAFHFNSNKSSGHFLLEISRCSVGQLPPFASFRLHS